MAGCSEYFAQRFEDALPKEEVALAERVLAQLADRDFAGFKQQMSPEFVGPTFDSDLQKMIALIPAEKPIASTPVGSIVHTFNGAVTTYNLTFEQQYPSGWLLAAVQLRKRDGDTRVIGMNVSPQAQSLQAQNRFTFERKGALHYVVLALAVAVPLFILHTLVQCFRTPIAKRKWLWMLFIALGITQFTLNWSTGGWAFALMGVNLLGAGFVKGGPHAAWIVSVGIPLGAIVFWLRRPRLMAQARTPESDTVVPAQPIGEQA